MDSTEASKLLVANLPWIERVSSHITRRSGLSLDETDEFLGWVRLRLVEDDYAILRKFRGETAITTYLTVVVSSLFRDYRISHWGRWRPSAAAKRMGDLAVRLEKLVYRDGYRIDQAGEILRASDSTVPDDRELIRMLALLPGHSPPRMRVGLEKLSEEVTTPEYQIAEERESAEEALRLALNELPPEDALIVRLRIWEGLSLADIARVLHVPQKPLYRRLEKIFSRLRQQLEKTGIDRMKVLAMLEDTAASEW